MLDLSLADRRPCRSCFPAIRVSNSKSKYYIPATQGTLSTVTLPSGEAIKGRLEYQDRPRSWASRLHRHVSLLAGKQH